MSNGLFVLDDLGGEGGFGNHTVAYESITFHGADPMTNRMKKLDTEQQCVARNNFLTELHFVDSHEIG